MERWSKLMKTEINYERTHRGRWKHSGRVRGVEKQRWKIYFAKACNERDM